MGYCKVSDNVPTKSELVGGTILYNDDNEITNIELTENNITEQDGYIVCGTQLIIVQNPSFVLMNKEFTVNSVGIYFLCSILDNHSAYTSKLTYGSGIVHTLDEKFIPDTIARISDINALRNKFILNSPDGTSFQITVDNTGKLIVVNIDE